MAKFADLKFLWYTLRLMIYMFPPLSFVLTKNWKKVFHDCFGAEILLADTVCTMIFLGYNLFRREDERALAHIILYSIAFGLNIMSLCMFAMHQTMNEGIRKAVAWYYYLFGIFSVLMMLFFIGLQMRLTMDGKNNICAIVLLVFGVMAEGYQVFLPLYIRVTKVSFVSDEKPIFWLKIYATIMKLITTSSEVYYMYNEGSKDTSLWWSLMVLSWTCIVCGLLQLIFRSFGFDRLSAFCIRIIENENGRNHGPVGISNTL